MPEVTTLTERSSIAELSEDERRFNRQVNYFVMRTMWQVVCGPDPSDTIYRKFETSRERYGRVIRTGVIRYGVGELASLQLMIGLRKEIFTGDVRFDCSCNDVKHHVEITTKDWETLLLVNKKDKTQEDYEAQEDSETHEKIEARKAARSDICASLKKMPQNDIENNDFYRLCFFLKNRKPAPIRTTDDRLRGAVTGINGLTFEVLDGCEIGQLRQIRKLLKEKLDLVCGMDIYKNARDKVKKENK